MEDLRKQIPSTLLTLQKLHEKPEDIHLGKQWLLYALQTLRKSIMSLKFNHISNSHTASKLQRLLVLESEHGPLPGASPVLDDMLHYLNQVLCCIQYTIQTNYKY